MLLFIVLNAPSCTKLVKKQIYQLNIIVLKGGRPVDCLQSEAEWSWTRVYLETIPATTGQNRTWIAR